jgi:membrane protease YdiL (CAAX protease family)
VKVVRAHPVVTMFVLAYALTWVVWVPRAAGADLGLVARLWTWMPAIAALITAVMLGKAAVRDWAARLVRWRVPWYWYVAVVVGPAAFSLVIAGCYTLLGGSFTAALPWTATPAALLPVFLVVLTLTDGLGEEPAWRGFALPRLLESQGAIGASLVVGILWALWHLPLLWTPGLQEQQLPWWLLILDVPAKSVFFTWIFLRTDGSVLIAALFHGATNLFVVSPAVATAGDLTLPVLATAAKWILIGVVLIGVRLIAGGEGGRPGSRHGRGG